jgi:hypothetical protein
LVIFGLELNFNINAIRSKIPKKKMVKNPKEVLQKREGLYERYLDVLLRSQDKLTKTERVKRFGSLSSYIFPKTKSV